jgi:hypothetical protein
MHVILFKELCIKYNSTISCIIFRSKNHTWYCSILIFFLTSLKVEAYVLFITCVNEYTYSLHNQHNGLRRIDHSAWLFKCVRKPLLTNMKIAYNLIIIIRRRRRRRRRNYLFSKAVTLKNYGLSKKIILLKSLPSCVSLYTVKQLLFPLFNIFNIYIYIYILFFNMNFIFIHLLPRNLNSVPGENKLPTMLT